MDLSVVIPFHDEAENVAPLLSEVKAALAGRLEYEVVCVDDGSRDETLENLRKVRDAGMPELRIVRHLERFGQSAGIHTGVKAARGPWIATLDGDGQNDPADIMSLVAVARSADVPPSLRMVSGNRRKRRDTWLRRLSSRIANAVRGGLLKDRTPDTGCGLKVFSRDAFLAAPFFNHMHRFLPALILRGGGDVVSVEVNHRPRTRGKSKYGLHNRLWVGIVDLFGVMWLQRRAVNPVAEEE